MDLDDLAGTVSRQRLMAHIEEFARRTKLSGSPEELESFHYLQARMEDAGFRTRLHSHDAYISLPGNARVVAGGRAIRAITHSMGASGTVRGIVVDAGRGDAAAFAAVDLRGRIALVEGIATPEAAVLARQAGAVGQIHVSPTGQLYEMCVSPVWGSPSAALREALPTTVLCTISAEDGAALRAALAAGEVSAELSAAVDTGWRKTPLLVADLDGPAPDGPFVLLSGHHDTWHYGVMDNGGANATMLEAARLLAERRAGWRRGLRVCFWSGHSHGRYSGSAWYADEHWDELDRRCAAHVNVDSTGAIGATVLTNTGVADELAPLAADEIAAVTGQLHPGRRQARAADASFWGIGVPSMFGSLSHQAVAPGKFRNALGWWWHTPEDLADKIDPAHLVRDTQVVVRVLARLVCESPLPVAPARALRALVGELAVLGEAPGVADLRARAAALAERAEAPAADAAIMRACRALVPLSYTGGDRFAHDPALPQPAWPALEPLRALAALPPGDASTPFHAVAARRACNRVAHALREAAAAMGERS